MIKTFFWLFLLLLVTAVLAAPTQTAVAQTEPEPTPEEGYPPPATPAQPEIAYPSQLLVTPTTSANATPYIAPTTAPLQPSSTVVSVIGDGANEPTAVPSLPISQSKLVRNRAVLWAGFLITLFIFMTAVYGAMLMYTRRRR
ncbi:MAG: hypothetical protein GY805_16240 [Chloroflexi bacterium]|nr:hypothetical protein [Chloroflexota bacterium]